MSARSGLVGKKTPGPIWGHPRPFSPWTEKSKKNIFLGGPMGPIHPVWGWGWDVGFSSNSSCTWQDRTLPIQCQKTRTERINAHFLDCSGRAKKLHPVAEYFQKPTSHPHLQTGWIGPLGPPRKISKNCYFFESWATFWIPRPIFFKSRGLFVWTPRHIF